ncbi:MAG: hypothetical protein ACYTGE_17040 [Planctomycetota bacterium]
MDQDGNPDLPNPNANSCDVHDNDGDGLYDEDPIDGIDNDGDGGSWCTDGIDNDGDFLIDCDDPDECGSNCDEDGPDDDEDGLVDEDGACEDAVIFCYEYEFDVTDLDIAGNGIVGDNIGDLRINLMVTFDSGGKRGGTCSVDVDCDDTNGVEKYVRTVQQRHVFDLGPDPCIQVCECVTLNDSGATSSDENCVTVVSNSIVDELICATGDEGTTSVFSISGTAFCQGGACSAIISNTAELTCEDESLIEGSPASAEIIVTCSEGGGGGCDPLPDGAFCTQTQGGWGQDRCSPPHVTCDEVDCSGTDDPKGNVGCFRDCYFDTLFPSGLVVGDPDGPDADGCYAILLTSSAAVAEYLPAGGTPAVLTADQTDPETTSAGVFGGQLVAATLNLAVDDAGLRRRNCDGGVDFDLGDLVYVSCVDEDLIGLTVDEVVAIANGVISGCANPPAGVSISAISDALAFFNESFVDCDGTSPCFNYSEECEIEWPVGGTMSTAYEDLPLCAGNDYDYNDLVVDIVTVGTFGNGGFGDLLEITFTFNQEAHLAGYTHVMHFAENSFGCDGTYDLYRNGVLVVDDGIYDDAFGIDVVIIENTGGPPTDTAELTITFNGGCAFSFPAWDDTKYHGENLFFDPWILVNNNGQEVHVGDVRMLTVPIDWVWPTPDGNRIWNFYDCVTNDGGANCGGQLQPVFVPNWWLDTDQNGTCDLP